MLRLAYLVGVIALTVFYYYFFGAGPTPSEYVEDLEWWRPWGTIMSDPRLLELAQLARAGFPKAWVPILLAWAPPLAALGIGWRIMRGSLGRAALVFLTFLMLVFVYYGMRAEPVWRFFEWRFVAVAASFGAILTAFLFSASLLDETLKRSRALAVLFFAAAIAGIFVLSTEVTGTNSEMQFNISPWPIVTLFGFLLAGATIASLHAAAGAAALVRARLPSWGVIGALAAALVVALLGLTFVFSAWQPRLFFAAIALVFAMIQVSGAARAPEAGGRAGLVRLATGAVLLVAILGSAQIAGGLQRRARDVTALQVLDALEKYKKDKATYPDKLDELVPEYLAEIPRPPIGLIRDEDDRFSYSNYGDSYALEFASVLWVQCQYSPPYEFAAGGGEDEEEAEVQTSPYEGQRAPSKYEDTPDVGAPAAPTEEDLAVKATLAKHGLNGSWTCPKEPPKLW